MRQRRQIQSSRLRRRLGKSMGRVRHSETCAFCALCERLGEDFGQAQDTPREQVHLGSAFRA